MTNEHAPASIDDLLDSAVHAINLGDRATAEALAGQVLAVTGSNDDAEELLAAPADHGEIRRLTIMFADLVDSTALSTRIELEVYRTVVGRYRDDVIRSVNQYGGHIASTKGDGLLAVFGHPVAHENDAHRAVYAGMEITHAIDELSERVQRRFGFEVSVRVGIHRGLVYLDTAQDDVYGLGANFAARVCSSAQPGTVAVSETIERVVRDTFEVEEMPPQTVKGVDGPIRLSKVVGERDVVTTVTGPMVGRDRELEHLRDMWRRAAEGTLSSPGVAFEGEGGIGKTRIAYAAVDLAQQSGAVVLGVYGSPFHTDIGLRPIRRLIERRCGIQRGSDPVDRLARLKTELSQRGMDPATIALFAPVLGISPESGYVPNHAEGSKLYEQIAAAIHSYLLACLGQRPGLILMDDVHWFDEDTIEVVRALLEVDSGQLMVVITGRKLPPFPATTAFQVKPLSGEDAEKLVHALDPALPAVARTAVRERCDGIPLYIEEVVAKLSEQSTLGGDSSQVPDTLYETLFARLRSAPNTLPVVGAAALIGSRFDRTLLTAVVDAEPSEVEDAITDLVRARVIQPVDKHSWRFHHELLREVATEVSPPSVRRRLHSRIADALAADASVANPEWRLVAAHYEAAERLVEAARAHQSASADARRRGALNEARTHLTRALESLGRTSPSGARDRREIALRLESGFLASAAQGHSSADAAAEFERCLQLIGPKPTPELFATLNALWTYYTSRGDLRRSTQLAETLQAKLDAPSDQKRGSTTTMGILAGFRGEFRVARDALEAAAAGVLDGPKTRMKTYYGPNDPIGGMYSFLAFIRFIQGDLGAADDALDLAEARSRAVGFPHSAFSLCYGRSITALLRIESGDLDRGHRIAGSVIELAKQYDFDEWAMVGWSEQSAAVALSLIADGADADALAPHIETIATVVDAWSSFDVKTWRVFYDGVLARLLIATGDTAAAQARLDVALQLGRDTLIQFYDAELLRLRAHTVADRDVRHQHFREAIELATLQSAHLFELRAAADDFVNTGEPAKSALEDALRHFPVDQTWPELARARALLG